MAPEYLATWLFYFQPLYSQQVAITLQSIIKLTQRLITKFAITNSSLLERAIKTGAEISDDELGYDSEEEVDQNKSRQKGGAVK